MRRHASRRAKFSGTGRGRAAVLIGAGVAALALLLGMCTTMRPADHGDSAGTHDGVHASPGGPSATGKPTAELGWGLTHTEFSADHGESDARAAAERLLSERPLPQNQAIMGWGALNPEPSPGRYDFADLDSRVDLIRRTHGTPVITLCCAPDWMKGGAPGTTDWTKIEVAPTPAHFADFAALAVTVARRYPDVRHFIVWNEFKGFWNDGLARWDYEGYTRLYNLVYRALKKTRADILVGGPYVVMDSFAPGSTGADASTTVKGPWGSADRRALDAVDYWATHKAGADFAVVDGSSMNRDGTLVPDAFAATRKFADLGRWIKQRTGLPLWWAEWYAEPDGSGWPEQRRVAVQAAAMAELAEGGADAAFYWNPERQGTDCPGCLWTSTELTGQQGGKSLPMLDLLRRFAAGFTPGTGFKDVAVADSDRTKVRVLASASTVLVVNVLDRPVDVTVAGRPVHLDGYGVAWLSGV